MLHLRKMAMTLTKLDLISFDDPATLLPLPLLDEPSRAELLQHGITQLDESMAANPTLLQQLESLLDATDISFLHPVATEVAVIRNPSSRLAKSLISRNPNLFQYGVQEGDAGPVDAATSPVDAVTPGPVGATAVAAHNAQPDVPTNPSLRKERPETIPPARERKRARRDAKVENNLLNELETEAAAVKLKSFLESSLATASSCPQGVNGRRPGRDTKTVYDFDLDTLKQIHAELLRAQAHDYLRLVPTGQLHTLLLALSSAATAGKDELPLEASPKSCEVAVTECALSALLCVLVVLSTPKLPPSLYLEEVLSSALDVMQYHLQYNVLALHDPRFKRQRIPRSADEESPEVARGAKTPRGKAARAAVASQRLPRWFSGLAGQLEQAFSRLSDILCLVRLNVEGLIPLVRIAQQTLTVESLQMLHNCAMGLAVSMFKYYPQQRGTVVNELVQGVLSHLSGKHVARHYPLQTTDQIQMVTALVMQLVQVTAELPAVDAEADAVLNCTKPSSAWALYFWHEVLKKLKDVRASKADTAADMRASVEAVVEDLLVALPLPEWPAATVLLRSLVSAIQSEVGIRSSESHVRLVCVDLVGLLARRLCALGKEAEAPEVARTVTAMVEAATVAAGKEVKGTVSSKSEVVHQLLLEHLAGTSAGLAVVASGAGAGACGASSAVSTSVSSSARQLICCNMLQEHLRSVKQRDGESLEAEKVREAAVLYRQIHDRKASCLGASTSDLPEVTRDAATSLCRWLVMDSILGRGRYNLLRWLADAGGGGRSRQDMHAAAVRAKAIKLLGGAIEADQQVLFVGEVQAGIRGALHDESVLVREAAVDLIGKYISGSAELAEQYYQIVVRASEDTGITVRKRAIRLLWECCVRCPSFSNRSDALLRIVWRSNDTEESMRTLVNKICAEVWFLPQVKLDDEIGGSQVAQDAKQRAVQLGEVVKIVQGTMGSAASIPFPTSMPLIVTIRNIVGEEGQPEHEAVRKGAREVADALLARALELQAEQDEPAEASAGLSAQGAPAAASDELFQCVLALHALCVADVKLLYRHADPQRVVRCLSPYIKEMRDTATGRNAERRLVVLAILGGCMTALRHLDDVLATELGQDLRAIITRVPHVQAVHVACRCLCTLGSIKPEHRKAVREQAARFYNCLERDCLKQTRGTPEQQRAYPRFLHTLGMLCRYGADILDEVDEAGKHPNCASALDVVLRFYNLHAGNSRIQEAALQALGSIFIARPHLAVEAPGAIPVLTGALSTTAPASLKARCLSSLTDLMRTEEEQLVGRQIAAKKEAAAAQEASTMPEAETRALAKRNGEGDTASVSNTLLQLLWDQIRALAVDTSPAPQAPQPHSANPSQTPPPTPSGATGVHGAIVRRRALELMEVMTRNGVIVPWSAMPALCALTTDPELDNAADALACLKSIVPSNVLYVGGQVPAGVAEAYTFHCKLASSQNPNQPLTPEKCRSLVEGLGSVWREVFQPDRTLKTKFLRALLNPLADGCCLASGSAAKADPHFLSFLAYVIAELPYNKLDELISVLLRLNEIISRRSEAVLATFRDLREAARSPQDADAAKPCVPLNADATPSANGSASTSSLPTRTGSAASSIAATVKAAFTVSLMLLLKQYLHKAYNLPPERIAKYDPTSSQHRKDAEKQNAVHDGRMRFNASMLGADVAARMAAPHPQVGAPGSALKPSLTRAPSSSSAVAATPAASAGCGVQDPGVEEMYKVLKKLIKMDEELYRHAVGPALVEEDNPAVEKEDLGGVLNLKEMMAAPDSAAPPKPPLASRGRGRGRGRGSRGGGGVGGRGGDSSRLASGARAVRGRPSTGPQQRGRKRKARQDSDSEDSGGLDGGSDDDEAPEYRPRATKRRLDSAL